MSRGSRAEFRSRIRPDRVRPRIARSPDLEELYLPCVSVLTGAGHVGRSPLPQPYQQVRPSSELIRSLVRTTRRPLQHCPHGLHGKIEPETREGQWTHWYCASLSLHVPMLPLILPDDSSVALKTYSPSRSICSWDKNLACELTFQSCEPE